MLLGHKTLHKTTPGYKSDGQAATARSTAPSGASSHLPPQIENCTERYNSQKSSTLNPYPSTRNPEPCTLKPNPEP